jgi:Chlamydia polymorphic membrane protein (Chlamydia_PMP) repeat
LVRRTSRAFGDRRNSYRALAAALPASAALLALASPAQAAEYHVYTSSISAMMVSAADHYCSLAEAVKSVNQGTPQSDCVDQDPTSTTQSIIFREAANKPFAQNHFVVTSPFNLTGTKGQIRIQGWGTAMIDSTGVAAFTIQAPVSAFFQRVTLTYTGGASGGRLVANYGTMQAYGVTFVNGNVTSHPSGVGGAIYNEGQIPFLDNSSFVGNKAKRGGAVYNKDGNIAELNASFSSNTATMAGGAIYNMSSVNVDGRPKAYIELVASTITGSSAPAGGAVFNRGEMYLQGTAITVNAASGTGSSETCAGNVSCDGYGGGVLNLAFSDRNAEFRASGGSMISSNTASKLGGGIYNAGVIAFSAIALNDNKASSGGAIYSAALGPQPYCEVLSFAEPSSISSNRATTAGKYSIVETSGIICLLQATATGNTSPFCAPGSVNAGQCPQ